MHIHDAQRPSMSTPIPTLADLAADGPAPGGVLVAFLSARVRALDIENRLLRGQVRELAVDRDDLLDAANVHALCEHEERLIGLVRFYDRAYRCSGNLWSRSISGNAHTYRQVRACDGQTRPMPAAV